MIMVGGFQLVVGFEMKKFIEKIKYWKREKVGENNFENNFKKKM